MVALSGRIGPAFPAWCLGVLVLKLTLLLAVAWAEMPPSTREGTTALTVVAAVQSNGAVVAVVARSDARAARWREVMEWGPVWLEEAGGLGAPYAPQDREEAAEVLAKVAALVPAAWTGLAFDVDGGRVVAGTERAPTGAVGPEQWCARSAVDESCPMVPARDLGDHMDYPQAYVFRHHGGEGASFGLCHAPTSEFVLPYALFQFGAGGRRTAGGGALDGQWAPTGPSPLACPLYTHARHRVRTAADPPAAILDSMSTGAEDELSGEFALYDGLTPWQNELMQGVGVDWDQWALDEPTRSTEELYLRPTHIGERAARRRVIDVTPIFNELELLRMRLAELWEVVDLFIVTEATRTFSNQPKPLYLTEAIERGEFAEYLHKLRVVIVRTLPDGEDPWVREWTQRQTGVDAIASLVPSARPDDLVISADVDEIPRAEVVAHLAWAEGYPERMSLGMDFYYYNFGWRKRFPWRLACAVELGSLKEINAIDLRYRALVFPHVRSAGWHISHQAMSLDGLMAKIRADSHHLEHNAATMLRETVMERVTKGLDIHLRPGEELYAVSGPRGLPRWLVDGAVRREAWKAIIPERLLEPATGPPPAAAPSSGAFDKALGRYLAFHAEESQKDGARYLIVQSQSEIQGLGNRILAVVSALVLAMLLDRVLLLDMDYAALRWNELFRPPGGIEWDAGAHLAARGMTGEELGAGAAVIRAGPPGAVLEEGLRVLMCGRGDVDARALILQCNSSLIPFMMANPRFRPTLDAWFPEGEPFGIVARGIITPSAPIRRRVEHLHRVFSQGGGRTVGIAVRAAYDTVLARVSDSIAHNAHHKFSQCAKALEREGAGATGPTAWVLGTDSPQMRRAMRRANRHKVYVFPWTLRPAAPGGSDAHRVDWYEGRDSAKAIKEAAIEFFVLARSDHLVLTSGSTLSSVVSAYAGKRAAFVTAGRTNCWMAMSTEPCAHLWSQAAMSGDKCFDPATLVDPYFLHMEDCASGTGDLLPYLPPLFRDEYVFHAVPCPGAGRRADGGGGALRCGMWRQP